MVGRSWGTGENGWVKGKGEGEQPAGHAAWEWLEAGLGCQQFCLGAYAKGGVPASWG